jgi:hypothetical protein
MVTGLANYAMSETSVILSNVDNLRINDAIARWLVKSVDKPDINVWWVLTVVPRKSRTCSDVCEQRFDVSRIVRILARTHSKCAAVHDHQYVTNDNIQDNEYEAVFDIQTQNKVHDLYVRNVGGQMYVRRSVLVYMVTGLPVLSVIMTVLLQMSH